MLLKPFLIIAERGVDMNTFNNLGMPIILSDEPDLTVEHPMPVIFLILGTTTFLVDFQYSVAATSGGALDLTKSTILEPNAVKRVVTGYTIYIAGSSRAIINRIYNTNGISPQKAYDEAYKDLKDIYENAIANLTNNRSSWDVVEWRCNYEKDSIKR